VKTPDPIGHIEFDNLCSFFVNPQNSFLRASLGIYISDETNDWENSEPFNLNNFADSRIRAIALRQGVIGMTDTSNAMAQASGQLPHGIHGDILQGNEQESVDVLLKNIMPEFLQEPLAPIAVDIQIEDTNITGALRGLCPQGQLLIISDKLYPWQTIQLWLKHLLLCCIRPDGVECITRVISLNGEQVLKDVEDPKKHLSDWLQAYYTGLTRPLPLFPKVSFAYAKAYDASSEDNWNAQNEASKLWEPSYTSPGESSKPANEYLYRGNLPLNDEFQSLAKSLIVPIIEAGSSDHE
jgi:exodeoxyribonuclease V gamma subunit